MINSYNRISINEVPKVSEETIKDLKEIQRTSAKINIDNFPQMPLGLIYSTQNLRKKISELKATEKKMKFAQNHPWKEKAIAISELALVVVIIAAAALLTYALFPIGTSTLNFHTSIRVAFSAIIVCGSLFGLVCLNAYYDHQWSPNPKKSIGGFEAENYAYPLYVPFIGPFIPLIQSCRGHTRFEKVLELQKKAVEDTREGVTRCTTQYQELSTLSQTLTNQQASEELNQLANYLSSVSGLIN